MSGKILVTGGLGFIGSHTVVALQPKGYDVVIIDNLSNSSIDVLAGITRITEKTPEFEKLDLREKSAVKDFFEKYTDLFTKKMNIYKRKSPKYPCLPPFFCSFNPHPLAEIFHNPTFC